MAAVVLRADRRRHPRADRLARRPTRAPGRIDSPLSREGAFLANNVLFAGFAFVVLLGTVFPLIVEAVNGDQLSVGAPYFERMTVPIGITLLFLMAVAPVLPWRKASGELLAQRLFWPAWVGTAAVVVAVLLGAHGLAPLLAFGLGGFAGGRPCGRWCWPSPAGLARRRRPDERRDDRAPRCRADRRRPGGFQQLRHRARADAGRRRQRHRRRPRDHLPGPCAPSSSPARRLSAPA